MLLRLLQTQSVVLNFPLTTRRHSSLREEIAMDKPITASYEEPEVTESFDDREIFGDAPADTASVVTGSHVVLHAV